jgi:hypothetical protein
MEYPKTNCLYKYYSYTTNSLSVLINKKVWFSKPASFNDPFDLGIDFINYISSNNFDYMIEVHKDQPGISEEKQKELNKIQKLEKFDPDPFTRNQSWGVVIKKSREDRKNFGVFCMSELNDNVLMWSHYADCHKGFCVEFMRIPQNILGNIEITRPVKYKHEFPSPNPFSDEGRKKSFDDLFFTKSIDWAYEKEWRLINEEGDIALQLPGEISAIIFGLQMPTQNKETIKNILSDDSNIIYRQAEKVLNSFKLRIVDC